MQNSWSYWRKIWMFHQIYSGISTSYCQFLKRIKVYIVSQHGMTRWFIDYFKGDMSRWLLFYVKSALKSARSSDGGERVKSYAGKTRGFPRQFLARALLTERLELANFSQFGYWMKTISHFRDFFIMLSIQPSFRMQPCYRWGARSEELRKDGCIHRL